MAAPDDRTRTENSLFEFELDTSMGEYRIPGETDILKEYVALFDRHFARHYIDKGVIARRAIHAKSHGCLQASFEVLDHRDTDLRYGLFREPAIYSAVARLSNGDGPVGPDTARIPSLGFAIKVRGISAEKLLPSQQEDTQDFLFLNQPAYIAADVRDYKSLMQAIDGGPLYKALALVKNLRGLLYRLKALPKTDPLNTNFWGVAPFRLGNMAVKYLIRPHKPEAANLPAIRGNDYLKDLVKAHVEMRDADFEFFLQKRLLDGNEKNNMPVEDYSVAWDETESVPVHVGRLRIPAQTLDDDFDREHGERLTFSPWNTTKDLRPLGSLNRARRVIYEISSRKRQEINCTRDAENSSN
jgi:hypothetical protein